MNSILQSIAPVIKQAQHVRINQQALEDFCSRFQGLETSFKQPFQPVTLTPEEKIQLDFAYNSANFCYWSYPNLLKWTIEYQGGQVSGAYGMKAAFNRALEEGFTLLDSSYLENLTEEDFQHITRGSGQLPLFQERVLFLRELGAILNRKYEGQAMNVVGAGEGDAIQLLGEVTDNFPCYNDTAAYKGRKILFYKRAQLFVHNTHKVLESQEEGLLRTKQLTALADYKIPQLLRNCGIIEYASELARKIDNLEIIVEGSAEEVEIRAFTLEVVERMVRNLSRRFPDLNSIELDKWLYFESKRKSLDEKPYHRTLTTQY